MRNLAVIMFALALILGTLTVIIARNVINAQRAAPVTVTTDETEEMSTLVVAAVKLQFGDEITAEKLKTVPWPKDETVRPVGSFETIAEIIGDQRRVAIRSMNINDPVSQEKISGFGYRATLSQIVPVDMRAIAIRTNVQSGVAGFILPGDRVDILHAFQKPGRPRLESTLIMRDVRVLAIDQIADETTQGAIVASTATVEVTEEEAQKLTLASKMGSLDLVLRPMRADEDIIDTKSRPIDVTALVTDNSVSEEPEKDEPKIATRRYRPIARTEPEPKPDPFTKMKITRALVTSEETVTKDGVAASANGGVPDLGGAMSQQIEEMSSVIGGVTGSSR